MDCRKCGVPVIPKRVIFRTGREHFRVWCPRCHDSRYVPHTTENERLFSAVPATKSKALRQSERIIFAQAPQDYMGRFGSDFEQLFSARFKAKYNSTVLRRGAPDFIVEADGKVCFVEVKHGNDRLSRFQEKYKELLEKTGTKVFVAWEGRIPPELERFIEGEGP